MSLLQIAEWNNKRNNLEFDLGLEEEMLKEEEAEFKDALKAYLTTDSSDVLPLFKEEAITDLVVDMIDAYCDTSFVYYGSSVKALGRYNLPQLQSLSIMHTLLTEILITHGVNMFEHGKSPFIDVCMSYVIEANQLKPISKAKGKVKKGVDWKDPKEKIKDYLIQEGFVADKEKALEQLKKQLHDRVRPKTVKIEDIPANNIDDGGVA